MISISDIEEPMWPRAPPSSARTTSRRNRIERSSSRTFKSCRAASAASLAIRKPLKVCCQRLHPFARTIKLTLFDGNPIGLPARVDSVGPPLGQKLVEQDHAPAQREQRVEQGEPRREGPVGLIDRRRRGREIPLQRLGKLRSRVQQEIGGELDRIVPAEIIEVDEDQSARWPSQRVVEAEIGRAQRPRRAVDRARKG